MITRQKLFKWLGESKLIQNPDPHKVNEFLKNCLVLWHGQHHQNDKVKDTMIKVNKDFSTKYSNKEAPFEYQRTPMSMEKLENVPESMFYKIFTRTILL